MLAVAPHTRYTSHTMSHDDTGALPPHDVRRSADREMYTTGQGAAEIQLNRGLQAIARGRRWAQTRVHIHADAFVSKSSTKKGKHTWLVGDVITRAALKPQWLNARNRTREHVVRGITSTCRCDKCAAAPLKGVSVERTYTVGMVLQQKVS